MRKREFYGRQAPLTEMRRRYDRLEKGEFIVVYGRRRLGKSELAKEFLSHAKGRKISLFIPDSSKEDVLLHLERDIERSLNQTRPIRHWDEFFSIIEENAKDGLVIVFDEVQRFSTIDKSFFSYLQKWWDDHLKYFPVYIIFIGSAIGMMRKLFLSSSSPLFSRKTWNYLIDPFTYQEFRMMFSHLPEQDKVELYSIFGGTPAYLSHVKVASGKADDKIESLCLQKGTPLYDEPAELLRTELKKSERYTAILHAIASGKTGQKEIADFAGFKRPNEANPYLHVLQNELRIIKRADPVGGKKKRGRYVFNDNYFHFWYRYIHPLQSVLELGNVSYAKSAITDSLPDFIGRKVEDVVRELLIAYNGKRLMALDLNFQEIGAWWTQKDSDSPKRSEEIDIVALGKDYALLGEVKWTNKPADLDVLFSLLRKSKAFPVRLPHRYMIFSKNGFTKECEEAMKKTDCSGLTLKDMEQLFEKVAY